MRVYRSGDPTDQPSRISGTYFGEAFGGKTHNLCTWHTKEGIVVVVAFDPDTGTARSMPNTVVVEVESWKEFDMDVLPYVRARELEKFVKEKVGIDARVDTFGIDTISVGATRCFNEILGVREKSERSDFGLLLNRLTSSTMQCMDITRQYHPDQRVYNCIFTSHLVSPSAESAKVRHHPAIPGQFKDILPRLGGFAFICKQRTTQVIAKEGPQKGQSLPSRDFYVNTCPPDDSYVCGDRIGGEGKLGRTLPPTILGTYPALMAAWGLDPEMGGS